MKLLQFIPIKLNFLLIVGICLGAQLEIPIVLTLIFIGISLVVLGIIFSIPQYRHSISFGIIAALSTICLGVLTISLAETMPGNNHYTQFELTKSQYWHLKIRKVLKSGYNDQYIADVKGIDRKKVGGKLLLSISRDSSIEKLNVDDEIVLWALAKALKPPLNPHQFNYSRYMSGMGIYHSIRSSPHGVYKKPDAQITVVGLAATARNTISNRLKFYGFHSDELGIIQALLLGERNEITSEIHSNYKDAGAVHMLAVSGLHIGIILLILDYLLRPLVLLANGKRIKLVLTVFLLWCFAILAGLSASVVRAVTMFSFVAYALYLNRPGNTFNILALSMFFILLLVDPMLLFQPGFQMSYLAVIFIVWMYPLLRRLWHPRYFILKKVWQLFSVSISAQLGVLPISLYYFHQFPGLFFVSNLLILPFLGILLGLGIVVILLALTNHLPLLLAKAYASLIQLMNTLISWVGRQDEFIIKDISFDGVQLVLSYLVICTLIFLLSNINGRAVILLLSGILGMQGWSLYLIQSDIKKEQVLILHQTANSVVLQQSGRTLFVYDADAKRAANLVNDYKVAERISKVVHLPLSSGYKMAEQRLLVIDSFGILPLNHKPEILFLRQSPKINLERFLDQSTPKLIIADGSNYLSFIARWRKTCQQKKIPFHYTGEKGAYYFSKGN
ncbi:ComEC/Rec2 family competence protein [Muriicola sp. Z0-33]|uniref:ComEC/Rec2 family competence protein n=1 Tax=Muriicola sp. Z0-33 TaxID=2816957 RepID=UPI0022383AE2|nr:ComEC/Rec2 family competence protein [Muriicola sp. Z0-33]MCW5515141.1 ComEC/Rec2 family competence protein [Muriicola sp. Z0-33]